MNGSFSHQVTNFTERKRTKVQDTYKVKAVVPIEQKVALTKYEAAEYSNIGINKIEAMLREPNCPFVLHVGPNKKLVKRKEFEDFISASFVI